MASWANSALTKQVESLVSYSSSRLETTISPPDFPPDAREPQLHRSINAETAVFENAYASANGFTHVTERSLISFERNERAELCDAALGVAPVDGTLAPRRASVCVLVNTKNYRLEPMLADALSMLASGPGADNPPPAHSVRFSVLRDAAARAYTGSHSIYTENRTASFLYGSSTLDFYLTWATVAADGADGAEEVTLRAASNAIPFTDRPFKLFQTLVKLLAQFSSEADVQLAGLFELYASVTSAMLDGAHARQLERQSMGFWGNLKVSHPEILSEYAETSEDFCGMFEFGTRTFLKIVPRALKAMDGVEVFFGLLLHEHGKTEQVNEYLTMATAAEKVKSAIFGLPLPRTPAELALAMHVLYVYADETDFSSELTTYGELSVPGRPLSSRGCRLPRLNARVVPLDGRLTDQNYLLPCAQSGIDLTVPTRGRSQWFATEEFVATYAHLFWKLSDADLKEEEEAQQRHSPVTLAKPERNEEDTLASAMLGVPLSNPAFNLGSMVERVVDRDDSPELASFLTQGLAQLGPQASTVEWFRAAATMAKRTRAEVAELNKRVRTLESEAERAAAAQREAAAAAAAEAKAKSAGAGGADAAATVAPASVSISSVVVSTLLRGLRRTAATSWVLKVPLTRGSAVAVVTALARASGKDVDEADVEWAKHNANTGTSVFDNIAAIVGHGLVSGEVLVLVNEDGPTSAMTKMTSNASTPLDLAGLCAAAGTGGKAPILSWARAAKRLTAYNPC